MKSAKKYIIPSIVTVLAAAGLFYINLPAINIRDMAFWTYLVTLAAVWFVAYLICSFGAKNILVFKTAAGKPNGEISFADPEIKRKLKLAISILLAIAAIVAVVAFVTSSRLFRASAYADLLPVEESEFQEDISEISFSQIPIVDRDAAQILGQRKIGEIIELVSQFEIEDYYTQINIRETPYRVSPLRYAGFLKWIANRDEGIPYYIKIDMANLTAAELVKLDEGIKYSPSEYFGRDLMRHVRFAYPTKMIEEISFEVNDEGKPYWILPYYTYRIGFIGGKDIAGIIMVDAITGEMTEYKVSEVPSWIDRVYSDAIVLSQANDYGTLQNGFFNSIFVQKNVITTTEGYNYIALRDDVWLYTGITSVVADESNIGFILVNLRTKETLRYTINGAEEYSAMRSAEGQVQEKGYVATFPILVNIEGHPSYFISLKDDAGTIKAYSFVSVTNYQIVGVDYVSINNAMNTYVGLLRENGLIDESARPNQPDGASEATLKIEAISSAVVDGTTMYYFRFEANDAVEAGRVYIVAVKLSDDLPFISAGDQIKITYTANDSGKIVEILSLEQVK